MSVSAKQNVYNSFNYKNFIAPFLKTKSPRDYIQGWETNECHQRPFHPLLTWTCIFGYISHLQNSQRRQSHNNYHESGIHKQTLLSTHTPAHTKSPTGRLDEHYPKTWQMAPPNPRIISPPRGR